MGFWDIANTVIGGLFSKSNTKATNQMNKEIAAANNQTSIDIARENNALQERMNRENNEFNRNSAIEMFNLENAYNSPAHQKQLLLEGGLNPATMYGTGGQQFTSDASTPQAATSGISPSMPNLVSPTMQPMEGVLQSLFGSTSVLTDSLKDIAESALSKTKKKEIETLLMKHYELLQGQVNGQEIENNWNKFRFGLDQANLPNKQKQEIRNLMSSVFKNYADGGASEALHTLRIMQQKLTSKEYDKLVAELPFVPQLLQRQIGLYDAQISTERERAETERTIQGVNKQQVENLKISQKDTDADIKKKIEDSISLYLDENGDVQIDAQKRKELAETMLKEAKNAVRQQGQDYWNPFRYIGHVFGASVSAHSGVSKVVTP